MATVDSASDARTINNTMRHQYKVLNDAEKANMVQIKDMGLAMHEFVGSLGNSREVSLAKTKIEEAVMWSVKHIIDRASHEREICRYGIPRWQGLGDYCLC